MAKAAIVILAGNDSHADHGRLVNALEAATEFAETDGDEVKVIFDGAGTEWLPALETEDGDHHDLYAPLRDHVAVCDFCATAFDVADAVTAADVTTLDEFEGHPSVRSLVADDYEIVTF